MALLQWLNEIYTPFFLFVFIFIALLMKLLFINKSRKIRRSNLPPGPPTIPFIGNLHQLGIGTMPPKSLQSLADKYGPITFLQLGEIPTVVVSSARLAKEVLKTHDLALASRPQLFSAKYLFYNCTDIAFAPYSAYWRHVRKICILELLSAKRVHSYSSVREEEVASLVHRVAGSYPGTTNLSKMLGLYANNVVCRVAFGRDFSEAGDHKKHGFQKMLDEYQELLGGFSVGDFFPSLEFIHSLTGMKARLLETSRKFDQLIDQIVNEHRACNKIKEHKDLVDILLEVQKDGSGEMPLTIDNIKAIILDMFAAGTDTTFITLDWAMTELLMNPHVMEKAQKEVRSVLGERRVVAESDLHQLQYMRAVIKEIFRLHPAVPVLVPRESMEDITLDGYIVPAKTRFFVNAWAIGRNAESWEDPNAFKPERFLDSNIDYRGQDFELIPFGAGRRGCPAITFAIAVVELALAQLLYSFDWELPPCVTPKDLDLTEVFGISMHRRENLLVVARPYFL
ncbi:cytochrome P450 71AP13-like [Cicer arietinum]|uniref:Cytochrome P450 71A1-like n=1 Tax=Cicer arietinum TaxID=3827 RepID=A0A1S2YAA9_CICAR|nr:cytochrome P450 71A1-like [Cicer arietinum]